MPARFPRLRKLVTKALEIAGAACASALTAVVLGNMREPPREPATPAVVRLAPADEQMIRYVRDESLALVEQLRGASDARSPAAPAAAPAANGQTSDNDASQSPRAKGQPRAARGHEAAPR